MTDEQRSRKHRVPDLLSSVLTEEIGRLEAHKQQLEVAVEQGDGRPKAEQLVELDSKILDLQRGRHAVKHDDLSGVPVHPAV